MEKITKKEWRETHKDYKEIIDGQRYILKLTNEGTCLVPVELVENEEDTTEYKERREKQKQEAIERLKILEDNYMMHKNVLKEFKQDETIYYSESLGGVFCGILYWLRNKPEFVNIVKEIEEKRNIYVYHCILNHYKDDGDVLTMLYISDDEEFWKDERKELEDGCPDSYTYSFDFPECSEFGSVAINGVNGGLARLY